MTADTDANTPMSRPDDRREDVLPIGVDDAGTAADLGDSSPDAPAGDLSEAADASGASDPPAADAEETAGGDADPEVGEPELGPITAEIRIADALPIVGVETTLDGSASTALGSTIESWAWTVDGPEAGDPGEGETVEYAFPSTGEYEISLVVTDDRGRSATTNRRVRVGAIPTAIITLPEPPVAGQLARLSGADSTDVDGEILAWRWSFGDGDIAEGAEVDHIWAAPGTYDVSLVVFDDDGLEAEAVDSIVVVSPANRDPEPRIDYLPYPAMSGVALRFEAGRTVDPDGDAIAEYRWSFGDGGTATGETVSHRYAGEGTYTVSLEAEDARGAIGRAEIELDVACGTGCYSGTWRVLWGDSEEVQAVECGATVVNFAPATCAIERDGGDLAMTCGSSRYVGTVDETGFDITLEVRPTSTAWCGDVWFEERITGALVGEDRWEGVSELAFRVAVWGFGCFDCPFDPVLKTGTRVP